MGWNREMIKAFLREFEKHEPLWNPSDKCYTDRETKELAWKALAAKFNIDVEEARKKMESLRGSFRREKNRIKKWKMSGKGNYIRSKWFAYESMKFLEDIQRTTARLPCVPRKDLNNLRRSSDDDAWRTSDEARRDTEEVNVKYEIDFADVDSRESNGIPSPLLDDEPSREDLMLKVDSMSKLDPIATYVSSKDECSTFGEHVANKLRNLSERYRAIAEHRIINVIFEVETDQYNANKLGSSDCYSQPSSTSKQNVNENNKRKYTPSTSSPCPSLEAEEDEMQ